MEKLVLVELGMHPNHMLSFFLLRRVQRIQKQLFKAIAVSIDSHADRYAILTYLSAPTFTTFVFDNSKSFVFESSQRVFGKDSGRERIPKIVTAIEKVLILGERIEDEGCFG